MFLRLAASALALGLSFSAAQAATVGSFTFDDNAFADDAQIALTPGGIDPATSPAAGADGNLSTATNLNASFVEIFFTDNVLINGAGNDLVIFAGTNNTQIVLTTAADTNASVTGANSNTFIGSGETGNTSGFSLNGAAFDLSDLGYADGAEVTGGLFMRRLSVFSTVWDVAALNSRDAVTVPPTGTVPLPAGLPLLLGALAAAGLVGRRRARAAS